MAEVLATQSLNSIHESASALSSIQLYQKKDTYTLKDYPEAVAYADAQNSVYWKFDEIKVEKDVQDIKVNLTEAERNGVLYVLKLFTKYELIIGNEYWGGRVAKRFPRPEIERMASAFQFFELNVHGPFYHEIDEKLGIATDEYYASYREDPVLVERMAFLDGFVDHSDDLLSLGVFAMMEGAVLYSSFAFLKHFQSEGKNKLLNIVRGINFSVRDENLHAVGGAWLFRTLKKEMEAAGLDTSYVEHLIRMAAHAIYEHECAIIDNIFSFGRIEGITALQLKNFVQSRLNVVLRELGYSNEFEVTYNPIADWFYRGINNFQFNDFFSGQGREYTRGWDAGSFEWKKRVRNVVN